MIHVEITKIAEALKIEKAVVQSNQASGSRLTKGQPVLNLTMGGDDGVFRGAHE